MEDDDWYSGVAIVASLILVVGLFTGLALGGAFSAGHTTVSAPAAVGPTYLYFTVTTSAHTLYDTYYPANVSVPHGEQIVITITSYDPGVNPIPDPYGNVIGTQGDLANYTLAPNQSTQTRSSLPNALISHTFSVTLPGMAGQDLLAAGKPMINVPVPVSPNGIVPATVSFTISFPAPGSYVWRCVAPCDPYSMDTSGFMIGSIGVT